MNQLTMADIEYSNRKKKTKREEFLDTMEEIIPWAQWVELIRSYYFNNVRGRKPIGIETMLRMYLMQIWLDDKNSKLIGEYSCQGYNTFGPFKLVGGTAKGHPTEDEISGAVHFYEKLL